MRTTILLLLSGPLLAAALIGCAPTPQTANRADPALDSMFAALTDAVSAEDAAPVEAQIWAHWADSGSPTVNILLERAAAAESAGDPDRAIRFLNEASALAPDFAEPWNRRASLAYDTEDYTGAIAAIQEALKREPRHFGALAGLGLIYEELGQDRAALEAFRAALAVHPHYEAALRGVARLEPKVDGRDA